MLKSGFLPIHQKNHFFINRNYVKVYYVLKIDTIFY